MAVVASVVLVALSLLPAGAAQPQVVPGFPMPGEKVRVTWNVTQQREVQPEDGPDFQVEGRLPGTVPVHVGNDGQDTIRNVTLVPQFQARGIRALVPPPLPDLGPTPFAYIPEVPAGGTASAHLNLSVPEGLEGSMDVRFLMFYENSTGAPRFTTATFQGEVLPTDQVPPWITRHGTRIVLGLLLVSGTAFAAWFAWVDRGPER